MPLPNNGLTPEDVAAIRAAGGELYCPGNGRNGATLNAWLVNSRQQILTNAHSLIGAGEGPELRQPLDHCSFRSFMDLAEPEKAAKPYRLRLNDYPRLFRVGAKAPVRPLRTIIATSFGA